jgi:protoheme IX farnesyltransferase
MIDDKNINKPSRETGAPVEPTSASTVSFVVKKILRLIKFRIAILSTMSAATGYVVAAKGFTWGVLLFIFGLFLLAGGSAALNQYQERSLDKMMERTKHRPIPSGGLSAPVGLSIAIGFIAAGLMILYIGYGPLPGILGFATAVLYNGVYTYLKRVTAFAAVPGALIGALPPGIGWLAGGGNIGSPILFGLVAFFYIWQVPHFWLLIGIHSNDYKKAGFPSMTDVFSTQQLARITYTWIAATICAGMMFPLFGMFNHTASQVLLVFLVIWMAWRSVPLARQQLTRPVFMKVFMQINMFALLIMVILIIDHGVLYG